MSAVLAATFLAAPLRAADAQDRCGMRDSVVALLAEKYEEVQVAIGITDNGDLAEVFAASDGSTWTLVITSPRGRSCMVAAGEGWVMRQQREPAPDT
jgi:hypothetical protein